MPGANTMPCVKLFKGTDDIDSFTKHLLTSLMHQTFHNNKIIKPCVIHIPFDLQNSQNPGKILV